MYEATASNLVKEVLDGYNCTVFAYGQTGSGKTHTMMGPDIKDPELKGVVPRLVDDVFAAILESPEDTEFTVKVMFVEIYLEKIRDLISPANANCVVRENTGGGGVWIQGAAESYAGTVEDLMQIIEHGSRNRAIASTNMNQDSSRSHSVLIITLAQKNLETETVKTGKLFLVDLAGSETVKKTGSSGQTLEEAKQINKSLSALGNVIKALTEGRGHVPYRDSKLTRILQDSLGGNSKTSLIIACSSIAYNREETLSTLRFGSRAKTIKNKPQVNQELSIAEYKTLLARAELCMVRINALLLLWINFANPP